MKEERRGRKEGLEGKREGVEVKGSKKKEEERGKVVRVV